MKVFEDGATYWLMAEDGSKLLVTAVEAGDGEFDLKNDQFSFGIWVGGNNLDEFELQRIEK